MLATSGLSAQGQQAPAATANRSSSTIAIRPTPTSSTQGDQGGTVSEGREQKVQVRVVSPVIVAKDQKTTLEHVFEWGPWVCSLALVIVGGLQVWLLRETLRAVKQQADIQESSMTQWIDMNPERIRVETNSKADPPEKVTVVLHWRIVNNTPHPFTLQNIETKVARSKGWKHFQTISGEVVAPKEEHGHNFYVFFVPVDLTPKETTEFLKSGMSFSIVTRVSYTQVSGRAHHQEFGEIYDCTLKTFSINHPLGQGPQNQWTEEYKEPSTLRVHKVTEIVDLTDPEEQQSQG